MWKEFPLASDVSLTFVRFVEAEDERLQSVIDLREKKVSRC